MTCYSYSHHKKNAIRGQFLKVFSITIAIIFCLNTAGFAQSEKLQEFIKTAPEATLRGAGTGTAFGVVLSFFSNEDTDKILLRSLIGGAIGGFGYSMVGMIGEEATYLVDNGSRFGTAAMILGLILNRVRARNLDDDLGWFIAGGSSLGLCYGVYKLHKDREPTIREQPPPPPTTQKHPSAPTALLQFDTNRVARLALPKPTLYLSESGSLDLNLSLLTVSF